MTGPILFCLLVVFPLGWLAYKLTAENRSGTDSEWVVLDGRQLNRLRLVKAWAGTICVVLILVVILLTMVGIASYESAEEKAGRRSEFGEDILDFPRGASRSGESPLGK